MSNFTRNVGNHITEEDEGNISGITNFGDEYTL